jgi:hypothetical protein
MRSLFASTLPSLLALLAAARVGAEPRSLKPSGKVTANEGVLQDAFALDETGGKLATIEVTGRGQVLLAIGPPGGRAQIAEISSFTSTPERIVAVGGSWFVISNEGQRRAAIFDSSGKLRRTTQKFDDCEVSNSPKAFVAVSERQEPGGNRRFSIQAYKPDGGTLMVEDVVVEGNGTVVGGDGATFLGFTNSHFSMMVEKPGAYNRRTDTREPPQFAMRDVKTGKIAPGKLRPNLENFLDYVHKRGEKPDLPAVIVLADGQKGFELVGPGETVRPINLTVPARDYDPTSLEQRQLGGQVIFSLIADRPGRRDDMKEESRYALGFFTLDPGSGRVTPIGEVPLPRQQSVPWSAGGNKIAVWHGTRDGNREILIYSR